MNVLSGSHIPILVKIMSLTDGSVLELGAGFFSTPLFYWLCKAEGREFVSYENDKKWCEEIGEMTTYIEDWDKANILSTHWSVMLIDHRPAHRRRIDARRLKDNADFIIMHDSDMERDRVYGYTEIYPLFKYKYDFTKVKPHTTVLSNFKDPKLLLT